MSASMSSDRDDHAFAAHEVTTEPSPALGILKPFPLAPEIDQSALVSFASAEHLLGTTATPAACTCAQTPTTSPTPQTCSLPPPTP